VLRDGPRPPPFPAVRTAHGPDQRDGETGHSGQHDDQPGHRRPHCQDEHGAHCDRDERAGRSRQPLQRARARAPRLGPRGVPHARSALPIRVGVQLRTVGRSVTRPRRLPVDRPVDRMRSEGRVGATVGCAMGALADSRDVQGRVPFRHHRTPVSGPLMGPGSYFARGDTDSIVSIRSTSSESTLHPARPASANNAKATVQPEVAPGELAETRRWRCWTRRATNDYRDISGTTLGRRTRSGAFWCGEPVCKPGAVIGVRAHAAHLQEFENPQDGADPRRVPRGVSCRLDTREHRSRTDMVPTQPP
jgi:hypothetical protein